MNKQYKNYPPLILASSSPRREELLRQIDLDFEVFPSSVHEDFKLKLNPVEFAQHYARLKAEDVAQSFPKSLIIGADTIVVLNDEIIGKPLDEDHAKSMLEKLSDKTHSVVTGVALVLQEDNILDIFSEKTAVTFQKLTDEQIDYYITNYQPLDKAGSYGIQDWFAVNVKKIDGCFYNVMGFPLSKFYSHFNKILEGLKK